MNIHPLWYVCILVRTSLIFILRYLKNNHDNSTVVSYLVPAILLTIGLGFIYNSIYGSNNEVQIAKVFWHETRIVHGIFYILAAYFFFKNNIDMNSLILVVDLIFSITYRIYKDK